MRHVVRWRVSGRVQGVGFRWFVHEAAVHHGVTGDVRNLADGSVEIRAAGESTQVARLLEEVRSGPRGARVDAVEALDLDPQTVFLDFTVRG